MRTLSVTIDITAPADRVWATMRDIDRWPEWTSVTSVEWVRGGALAAGAQARLRQPGFPPALWTVTEVVEGKSFTWECVVPGIRVIGHHAVEATLMGSRATLGLEYRGLLGGLWGWLTRRPSAHYLGLEASGLKARSERIALRRDEGLLATSAR